MLALEWRLTLLALVVLPLFIIPAKRVGRRLQAISREQMEHNAAMNTQMTERFNVAGAHAGQAVRPTRRRGRRVLGQRAPRCATPASARRCTGGCSSSPSASSARSGRRRSTASAPSSSSAATSASGTLVALAALVTRVYQPLTGLTNARVDLMTSMVSFERVFEVLDAPEAITDRPGAVDLVEPGRVGSSSTTCRSATRRRPT